MDWLIPAFIVVGLVALFWFAMSRHYGKIFAAEHSVEVARGLVKMKTSALTNILEKGEQLSLTREDPRVLLTSAGLAIAYTITREAEGFVHHYSISLPGHPTPSAVGEMFTLYIARLLGVPLDQLRTEVSPAGVYHAEFLLTPDSEGKFARIPVLVPTAEEARDIHRQCQQIRQASRT